MKLPQFKEFSYSSYKNHRRSHSCHFFSIGESTHKIFSITKNTDDTIIRKKDCGIILIPSPSAVPDSILIPSTDSDSEFSNVAPPELNSDSIIMNQSNNNFGYIINNEKNNIKSPIVLKKVSNSNSSPIFIQTSRSENDTTNNDQKIL